MEKKGLEQFKTLPKDSSTLYTMAHSSSLHPNLDGKTMTRKDNLVLIGEI